MFTNNTSRPLKLGQISQTLRCQQLKLKTAIKSNQIKSNQIKSNQISRSNPDIEKVQDESSGCSTLVANIGVLTMGIGFSFAMQGKNPTLLRLNVNFLAWLKSNQCPTKNYFIQNKKLKKQTLIQQVFRSSVPHLP